MSDIPEIEIIDENSEARGLNEQVKDYKILDRLEKEFADSQGQNNIEDMIQKGKTYNDNLIKYIKKYAPQLADDLYNESTIEELQQIITGISDDLFSDDVFTDESDFLPAEEEQQKIEAEIKKINDDSMNKKIDPKTKTLLTKIADLFNTLFNKKDKILKDIEESSDPTIKAKEPLLKKLYNILGVILALGSGITLWVLVPHILKHLIDSESGCYQFLPDDKKLILDSLKKGYPNQFGCGNYYEKNPTQCCCLFDSDIDITMKDYLTSQDYNGNLGQNQLDYCNTNNSSQIQTNPTCMIYKSINKDNDDCRARDKSTISPLGCTRDYRISYGYVQKTVISILSELSLLSSIGKPNEPNYWTYAKYPVIALVILISLVLLFFLIKFIIKIIRGNP